MKITLTKGNPERFVVKARTKEDKLFLQALINNTVYVIRERDKKEEVTSIELIAWLR